MIRLMRAITRFPKFKIERGHACYMVYRRDEMFFGWNYQRTFDTLEETQAFIEGQKGFPIYVD